VSSDEALVRDLVDRFPQLEPAFQEHLRNNKGEVLPYVFFWPVTQKVVASYRGVDRAPVDWRGFLTVLADRYAAGDADVQVLINTSFLDSLPDPGREGAGIVAELPPVLRAAFDYVRPVG
jgi:hypothetical protein